MPRAARSKRPLVREHEVIALNAEEWGRFQQILLVPPVENDRLRRALEEH